MHVVLLWKCILKLFTKSMVIFKKTPAEYYTIMVMNLLFSAAIAFLKCSHELPLRNIFGNFYKTLAGELKKICNNTKTKGIPYQITAKCTALIIFYFNNYKIHHICTLAIVAILVLSVYNVLESRLFIVTD